MTDQFIPTARAMAEFLGLPGYPFVVIPHPLSDNTDDEIRAKAEEVARQAAAVLRHPARAR